MSLVVDASIVAKWILDEPGSAEAQALRTESHLLAPALLMAEVGNTLWKAVRRGLVDPADAQDAFSKVFHPFEHFEPSEALHRQALSLALDLNHPIYDCFYLALALRENATLVTADALLSAAAEKVGVRVRMI